MFFSESFSSNSPLSTKRLCCIDGSLCYSSSGVFVEIFVSSAVLAVSKSFPSKTLPSTKRLCCLNGSLWYS